MKPAAWRVWAGPVGGWHRFDVLAGLSPEARDLYAELLALSTPIDRVTALPGAGWHSSRQASVSMLELERRTGHRLSRLYFARHELEHAGLVQVLMAGGFGGSVQRLRGHLRRRESGVSVVMTDRASRWRSAAVRHEIGPRVPPRDGHMSTPALSRAVRCAGQDADRGHAPLQTTPESVSGAPDTSGELSARRSG